MLPPRVLENLRSAGSENALLWNLIYPLARPTLHLSELLSLRPLWGTPSREEDELLPFYWGFSVDGAPLEGLREAVHSLGGGELTTEVDLVLLGTKHLIVVEAKHLSSLGRCGRYARGRCPEIHRENVIPGATCRYWEDPHVSFSRMVDFGERPVPGGDRPPCSVHYQLGRTLLLADGLAARLGRIPHLWLIAPAAHWKRLERDWLDFAERVRDPAMWRRLRVLPWEAVRSASA